MQRRADHGFVAAPWYSLVTVEQSMSDGGFPCKASARLDGQRFLTSESGFCDELVANTNGPVLSHQCDYPFVKSAIIVHSA